MDHLCFLVSCVSHAFASVHCCLVVTCLERADLLALVGDIYCISVTFPCGILFQVWWYRFLIFAIFLTFTDRSKALLLLWIICVMYVLFLLCFRVCSLLPCGHLLVKG